MMLLLLAAINFLLASFDAWLTRRRIRDFGVSVELNPGIRWLSTRLGPEVGAFIGILGPTAAQTIIFVSFGWPIPLAILIGLRLRLFYIQLLSLKFEKQVKQYIADYNLGRSSQPPSAGSPDDSGSLSQTPPISSKDETDVK